MWLRLFFVLLLLCKSKQSEESDCTRVSRTEEPLLVLSTLSGTLIAIDPLTAETRWMQQDEPNIKTNTQINDPSHVYFADPTSGSIYKLQSNSENKNQLTKLPYTIPELVQRSPCKSSDGILFSGRKTDSWVLIDPFTGQREIVMGFDPPANRKKSESIGFATSRGVYLGRTQYTVQMFDSLSKDSNSKPWNVTFYDYSSHTMDPELVKKYEFIHVTSSTTGKIITINRKTGGFLWEKLDIDSPIVSMFILSRDGFLSVPFTTVAEEVIDKVSQFSKDDERSDFELIPTVFIGENKGRGNSLYAIPAYVDDNVPTIRKNRRNLIEGPIAQNEKPHIFSGDKKSIKLDYIMYGYYENYETEKVTDSLHHEKSNGKELIMRGEDIVLTKPNENDDKIIMPNDGGEETTRNRKNLSEISKEDVVTKNNFNIIKHSVMKFKNWFDNEENKIIKLLMIILIGMLITMFWYFHITVRELRQQSQNGSKTIIRRSTDSNSEYGVIDNGDEIIEIGKLSFNPKHVLGKGCEGTFVFKGEFDKREVAVKRLLPDCFTLADREVALLRESDTHENVVRYFCTESDRQFRYIAVELCSATLQDYIEGEKSAELKKLIYMKEVLYQATRGLNHLHSLNIVHRDIKPQNVLISLPDNMNRVRALISDFGLCKKINKGKASFSKRSGVTGTDGWIAPEMLKGNRTTISVDIFSMGCVYYYVLSGGSHLFGDTIKRQANILSHEYNMSALIKDQLNKPYENMLAIDLIKDMIMKDPTKRPRAEAILKHPLFWREEKILSFFQDISDRIEKLDVNTDPLRTLERNAKTIIRDNWKDHLEESLREDLRKHRDYVNISVRDLLRALRNKKHHYHELSHEIQKLLGSIPIDFTKYWIVRFPQLLTHSYHAMESCSKETAFRRYYTPKYVFTKPDYLFDENYDNFELKEICDNLRQMYNKSPKKENRQPNNAMKQMEKSKRGAYNFSTNNNVGSTNFITRDDMVTVNRRKKNTNQDEKMVWTNFPNK